MILSRIRSEQSRNQDTGDAQEELNDEGTYTQNDSGGAFSSAFMRNSSGFGTSGGTPFNRKLTQATMSGYFRKFSALVNSQYRKKDVDASDHVLDTYHDSFLFGKVPTSVRVRAAIRGGKLGHFWHFVEFSLAITSGVLYVYSTYHQATKYNWVNQAQNWISVVFLVDYVLRVYSESVRLYYIFSFWGIIDLLSAVPIIYFFSFGVRGGRFLRLLQFLRIIRILTLMSKLGIVGSTVLQQILLLVVSTFGAVFLIAGVFQYVEYDAAPASYRDQCPPQGCINFWDAFYFIVVTISTVGYGDVTPKTQLGQLVSICTIILALTILPIQIGKITYLASRRPYGGYFNERKIIQSRYLIMSGNISFQDLQNYLAEFFNPTHCEDLEIYPLRVTILGPYRPSFEMKQLLSLYNGLVEFIEGSPIKQADLNRICAGRATAFFLLADKEAEDREVEDAAQIVKALAVHRFCSKDVRIIVEVLEPLTQNSAVWDQTDNRVEVVCPIKYHYKMIARSCLVKGLYTFVTNLFTSEIKLKGVNEKSFVAEYFHSFDNEIYPLIFPKACCGMLFEEVVEFAFENFNVLLFALDVNVLDPEEQQRSRKVFLHPKGHVIDADDIGLVICWDLHTAYAISKFGDQTIEIKKWRKPKRQLSTLELQKYRTGPIIDTHREECDPSAENISHTDENADTLEARMKSEISRRLPSKLGSFHGGIDGTEGSEQGIEGSKHASHGSRHGSHGSRHGGPGKRDRAQGSTNGPEGSRDGAEGGRDGAEEGRDGAEGSRNAAKLSRHGSDDAIESGYGTEYSNGESFNSGSTDDDEGNYPKGMSLEKATEVLLAWPPCRPAYVQPHQAVLERRQDTILQNLKERSIPIVALDVPHVLVCCQSGWPQHLFYFVKELRRPDLPSPPIVILHPTDPSAYEWGKVGMFEDVYFLKGSPIYELDLMRGGVLQAEKVVILGFHDSPVDLAGTGVEDNKAQRRVPSAERSDVDNIVIAANVERLVGIGADLVMVDMQHTLAFHYLRPKFEVRKKDVKKSDYQRNPDGLVHLGPPFMQGKAVSPILLGFLLRSSFYNRKTTAIVDQLLEGGHTIHEGTMSCHNPRILEQIPVPKEYVNKHYGEMFTGMLRESGTLALGLYRAKGTLGSPIPYVFTNPVKESIVHETDLVYIIT